MTTATATETMTEAECRETDDAIAGAWSAADAYLDYLIKQGADLYAALGMGGTPAPGPFIDDGSY